MVKQLEKLTSLFVRKVSESGWYGDGGNLWLQVTPSGNKSWLFRYKVAGVTRVLGLGATHTVSLAQAREVARTMRLQLINGVDPAEHRKAIKASARNTITFADACTSFIKQKRVEWKSEKHADQWTSTLKTYCGHINNRSVATITTRDVLTCLEPIWTTKTETASRLRQRIERVLDWATTAGYRSGANPALWGGVLENLLPSPNKLGTKANHPSLEYTRAPAFYQELKDQVGIAPLALRFLILTAARSGEVRGATFEEVQDGFWTIPASRMKASVAHVVPLPRQALALIDALEWKEGYLFPSVQSGKTISDMAMTALLRRMDWRNADGKTIVAHGFRSTFRMWAAERSDAPREVAEHALAHKLPDKVEAAYQRGTLLNRRALLMQEWANFLDGGKSEENSR